MLVIRTMSLHFRLTKMADIAFITILYFAAGFITAKAFDKYVVPEINPKEKETTAAKVLRVFWYVSLTAVAIYIWRNIIEQIPSPFEGVAGLKHHKVHELIEAPILIFAIFYYQRHLDDRMKEIYNLW
jgi:hypothetical protein